MIVWLTETRVNLSTNDYLNFLIFSKSEIMGGQKLKTYTTKYYKNYNRFKLNGFLVFITKKFRKIALLRSKDKFKKKISHINFI